MIYGHWRMSLPEYIDNESKEGNIRLVTPIEENFNWKGRFPKEQLKKNFMEWMMQKRSRKPSELGLVLLLLFTNSPKNEALAGFADEVNYYPLCQQQRILDLLHEDLEQIDDA
ncbi:hypothetical protein Tco_0548721 [Tanacetum coccineum]